MPQRPHLTRALGLIDCILLVVGAVVGSGIFLVPGTIARAIGSFEAILFVWVLGGALTFCGAMAFAELGAAFPHTGGLYVFLREAYGSLTAFLYGWCLFFVIVAGSIAILASGFAVYLSYFVTLSATNAKLAAVSVIGLLALANCLGVRTASWLQNILSLAKIGTLIGIAVVLFSSPGGGFDHLRQPPSSNPLSFRALGLAMVAVLWTYDGWHLLTFAAGEVRNPERNVTAGLLGGTLLVMLLYVSLNVAYLYTLPLPGIAGSWRVASDAMEHAIGTAGLVLVVSAILLSVAGVISSNMLGGPRVFLAMAEDGLFFRGAAYIDSSFHVPTVAIVLTGIWAAVLTWIGSFERLFNGVIFVAWIFYALGGSAVIVLRRKKPDIPRPYKTWGYPWAPILFSFSAATIVLHSVVNDFMSSCWGLVVVLTGFPAYCYWARRDRHITPARLDDPGSLDTDGN
jgi:APA family basic amino acid/polyamine antiporter